MLRDQTRSPEEPVLTRRSAISFSLALATASLACGPASAAGRPALDPNDPQDARIIYRKLRYRADSGLLFSWVKGPYMAAIYGELIPMYAINLGSISRVTERADGGFDLRDLEISFRVDVETGKRLTSFRNPITNETVPVKTKPQGPNTLSVSRDNIVQISDVPGGPHFEMKHFPVTTFVHGDDVYIRDRSHSRVTMSDGTVSMLNEVSTIYAPRAQVLDPSKPFVETKALSNDVRSWPAWLNMGDRPGNLALLGMGGKVREFNDLPEDWRAMLHEVEPEIANDPVAALDRGPRSLG